MMGLYILAGHAIIIIVEALLSNARAHTPSLADQSIIIYNDEVSHVLDVELMWLMDCSNLTFTNTFLDLLLP